MSHSKLKESKVESKQKSEPHSAVLGLILVTDNCVHGVTANHVLKSANGEDICVWLDNEYKILGKTLEWPNRVQEEDEFDDIGIIQISDDLQTRCSFGLRNSKGQLSDFSVFNGSPENLYGQNLFACCRPNTQPGKERNLSNQNITSVKEENVLEPTLKACRVLPKEVHETCYNEKTFARGNCFLVESISDDLVPGDSGAAVFTENNDGKLEIVGLVSGEFLFPMDKKRRNKVVVCGFISKSIAALNRRYEKKKDTESYVPGKGGIQSGTVIHWWIPVCNTKDPPFDWVDRVKLLMWNLKEDSDDVGELEAIKSHVHKLSLQVDTFDFGESDLQSNADGFHFCMKACQCFYKRQISEGENFLKAAFNEIMSSKFPNLLLSRIIQFVCLLYLTVGDLEKADIFFKATKQFMVDFEKRNSASKQILGYYHLYYARYFECKNMIEDALNECMESLRLQQEQNEIIQLDYQGPLRAWVQKARILLQCLEDFSNISKNISVEQLESVENWLNQIQSMNIIEKFPVLNAEYLLCLCDLHYRTDDLEMAMEKAKECVQLTKKKGLSAHEIQANSRCTALESRL